LPHRFVLQILCILEQGLFDAYRWKSKGGFAPAETLP
jgi:hypothetical protein